MILDATKAINLDGIEKIHTKTVYKKAKPAMAGKANVYKILKMTPPVVKGRFCLGILKDIKKYECSSHIVALPPDPSYIRT